MLTRLKVSGFKNLFGVDVLFGPFTCIAGANGVGKSNLFDAIKFLSALADRPLMDAASCVRDEDGRSTDVWSLFLRREGGRFSQMSFEAEMIVPAAASDDLGQDAVPSITFLRYSLELIFRESDSAKRSGLEIMREELTHITHTEAPRHLLFPHSGDWRRSAVNGVRRGGHFISTEGTGDQRVIKLHQDKGHGRPIPRLASTLPRSVLSTANAAENPTALLARREMQSWRLLQLEPTALRRPDPFTAPTTLGENGSHLPSTLSQLARLNDVNGTKNVSNNSAFSKVANRLADLISDVRNVSIDRDEKRELLTLFLTGRDGTRHPAHALSDGTLRFLALAVLELDPQALGVICLEEPENGIHPERVPAMLKLLQDIAVDVRSPIGVDNPLRQVIINTHSPAVVQEVPEDTLLIAESSKGSHLGYIFNKVSFSCLPGTWRSKKPASMSEMALGRLLAYLNPVIRTKVPIENWEKRPITALRRRVIDRDDLQQYLPFPQSETFDATH